MKSWMPLTAFLAVTVLLLAPWAAAAASDAGQLASAQAEHLARPTPQPPTQHAITLTETRILNPEAMRFQPATPIQATAPSAAAGWTTIMTEDFEGGFPGPGWQLWPTAPSEDHPTWGMSDHLPYSGAFSGYCVGSHIAAPGPYPNNVDSWMVYGPFDTSSDCDLQVLFWMWYDTQPFLDELFIGASADGTVFDGLTRAGDSEGWLWEQLELTDFAGHTEVWIAFRFSSNGDVTDEGAYVDDIVLRKASAAPSHPTLSQPADGSCTTDTTPAFDWQAVDGATAYRLEVDNDPGFGSPEITKLTDGPGYTPGSPLAAGTYYWRVRAENGCGSSLWSGVWDLLIDTPPGTPNAPSPANHAVGVALNADLDWADAAGAMTYAVHFGESSPPPFYVTTGASDLALPQLDPSTHYFWQVEAHNDCGSAAGPLWDFTTGANHAPALGVVDPSSGSGPVGAIGYFTTTWSDADGWQDLKQCYFHIGDSPSLPGNVTLLYNAAKDKLWLLDDTGTSWQGGCHPGDVLFTLNSQAILDCGQSAVQGAGDTLGVRWAVEFRSGFEGAKKLGLKCKDRDRAKAKGKWKGTWAITP